MMHIVHNTLHLFECIRIDAYDYHSRINVSQELSIGSDRELIVWYYEMI